MSTLEPSLQSADQEHAGDDERGAGGAAARDPLADERRGERDREEDARLPHRGDRSGGREPERGQDEHVREEAPQPASTAAGRSSARSRSRPDDERRADGRRNQCEQEYGTGAAYSIPSASTSV